MEDKLLPTTEPAPAPGGPMLGKSTWDRGTPNTAKEGRPPSPTKARLYRDLETIVFENYMVDNVKSKTDLAHRRVSS